jgi:hypothetical protein
LKDRVRAFAEAEQITIEKVVPQGGGTPSVWYTAQEGERARSNTPHAAAA